MERLTKIAEMILAEAKAKGADYAHCVVRESEKREFNVDGGQFSLMRTLFDRDVAVTVLKDQRKGSVHVNRFDDEAVRKAVAECISASESAEPDPAWQFADEKRVLLCFYRILAEPNPVPHRVYLKGLERDALYRVDEADASSLPEAFQGVFTGSALMEAGVPMIWDKTGDFVSRTIVFHKV